MEKINKTGNKNREERVVYSEKRGRLEVHRKGKGGYACFWNPNMISLLKRHFCDTKNSELSELLGVSQRTLIRKARQLGLEKSDEFLHRIIVDASMKGRVACKQNGYPQSFKKRGLKFKGNQYTGRALIAVGAKATT